MKHNTNQLVGGVFVMSQELAVAYTAWAGC